MNSVDLLPGKKSDISAALEYNRANNWPDLTPQAKVFVHEYSLVGDIQAARRRVKISMAVASRLLRDPLVRAYLDDLTEDHRKDSIITREFMELQWLETLEQVNGDIEVAGVTRDGEEYMAKSFNANAKVSVLKEMNNIVGIHKEKTHGGVSVNIDLSSFTGTDAEGKIKDIGAAVVIDQPTE